jgi:hypothetical protein
METEPPLANFIRSCVTRMHCRRERVKRKLIYSTGPVPDRTFEKGSYRLCQPISTMDITLLHIRSKRGNHLLITICWLQVSILENQSLLRSDRQSPLIQRNASMRLWATMKTTGEGPSVAGGSAAALPRGGRPFATSFLEQSAESPQLNLKFSQGTLLISGRQTEGTAGKRASNT